MSYYPCSKTRRFGPFSRRLSALRTLAVAFHPYSDKKSGKEKSGFFKLETDTFIINLSYFIINNKEIEAKRRKSLKKI